MWLRSEPGQGACFAFDLPWRDAATALGTAGAGAARMSHKILIADDEPNIVISLEYLIKREGFEVSVARDGQEALDAIRRRARPGVARRDDAGEDAASRCARKCAPTRRTETPRS